MATRAKVSKKRVNKDLSELQARRQEVRLRRRTAKKQAKEARKLLKEAKKVAKRAKAELQSLSKKLKQLLAGVEAGNVKAKPRRRKQVRERK